ncbi:MAG: VWA domain-containing protein [Cryomorphaceae bacterium]|nr:VWA domain-containing protein [Cryomorphaceae bacterium]
MFDIHFQHPGLLWLLLVLPLVWTWLLMRRRHFRSEVRMSVIPLNLRSKLNPMMVVYALRTLVMLLLIIALAGPRSSDVNTKSRGGEGIEIMLAIDISTSMLAKDFKPDRLEATKRVAAEFVQNRPMDKIGLVLYAGESFTKTPPTTNHALLLQNISEVTFNLVEDGTAIGMGLATAVNRLRNSESKSKVVILLSDGENNRGMVDPLTAADLAQQFGIRVYTIGVGSKGSAPTPYAFGPRGELLYKNLPVTIDEALLKAIAEICGGKYFRATDDNFLRSIFDEIDQMERIKLEDIDYIEIEEKQHPLLLLALGLFLVEVLLRKTWLKSAIDL